MFKFIVLVLVVGVGVLIQNVRDPSAERDMVIREHFVDLTYLNVGLDPKEVEGVIPPPLKPDIFQGKAWISIQISKMKTGELAIPFVGFVDGLLGQMTHKVNVMVKDGYGRKGFWIARLDFADGVLGRLKAMGAKHTQGIPTGTNEYSFQDEGQTHNRSITPAWGYMSVTLSPLEVTYTTKDLSSKAESLAQFITDRTYKFVYRPGSLSADYALYTVRDVDYDHFKVQKNEIKLQTMSNVKLTGAAQMLVDTLGLETNPVFDCSQEECFTMSDMLGIDRKNQRADKE